MDSIPYTPYRQTYDLLWHDTDAARRVRPSAILKYMQETANCQCAASGYNLDVLRDTEGMAFLLSQINLRFDAPLYAYDRITVETFCPPSLSYSFNRCFRILRDGQTVAEASSVWALIRLSDRSFVRASAFCETHTFPGGAPIPPDALPHRAHIPASVALHEAGERRIVYSDLDYNRHMNNTHYPDMLCDFCPDIEPGGKRVHTLSMNYRREAAAGEVLRILTADEGDTHYFRTQKSDGETALEAVMTLCD